MGFKILHSADNQIRYIDDPVFLVLAEKLNEVSMNHLHFGIIRFPLHVILNLFDCKYTYEEFDKIRKAFESILNKRNFLREDCCIISTQQWGVELLSEIYEMLKEETAKIGKTVSLKKMCTVLYSWPFTTRRTIRLFELNTEIEFAHKMAGTFLLGDKATPETCELITQTIIRNTEKIELLKNKEVIVDSHKFDRSAASQMILSATKIIMSYNDYDIKKQLHLYEKKDYPMMWEFLNQKTNCNPIMYAIFENDSDSPFTVAVQVMKEMAVCFIDDELYKYERIDENVYLNKNPVTTDLFNLEDKIYIVPELEKRDYI